MHIQIRHFYVNQWFGVNTRSITSIVHCPLLQNGVYWRKWKYEWCYWHFIEHNYYEKIFLGLNFQGNSYSRSGPFWNFHKIAKISRYFLIVWNTWAIVMCILNVSLIFFWILETKSQSQCCNLSDLTYSYVMTYVQQIQIENML